MISKRFIGSIRKGAKDSDQDSLQISFGGKRVKGTFRVYYFMDHEHYVAYIPSLRLTGYGDNKKEAVDMLFDVVLDDFFENILELPLEKANGVLSSLGWKRNKFFHKKFSTNSFVDKEGILRNFNLPNETKIESEVLTAA
jgi:hypothetical protein